MKYRAYIQAVERKGKKGVRVTLFQRLYFEGQQWQAALGISMPAQYYDKKAEAVITGEDAERYNRILSESKQIIRDIMLRYELIEHITPTLSDVTGRWREEMVKRGLLAGIRVTEDKPCNLLQDRMDEFIQDQTAVKGWEEGTAKRFKVIKGHLIKYNKQLKFEGLTDVQLLTFLQHLIDDCNLANTTVQRYSGLVRWYLRWCSSKGYYTGKCHETFHPKFKGGDFSDKNIIYLTTEELRILEDYQFTPEQAYLERVRDAFLFSCFSGLRYSDVKALRPENIGDVATALLTRKDRTRLSIELNKHTRAILAKYKDEAKVTGRAIPLPSNQKANKYLHELCQLCGLDTPTSQIYNHGGESEEVWLPKYELITFHVGRKTFITQALRLGIPVPVIMKFSGHKTIKNLNRYMNIVDELKKKEMAKFDEI